MSENTISIPISDNEDLAKVKVGDMLCVYTTVTETDGKTITAEIDEVEMEGGSEEGDSKEEDQSESEDMGGMGKMGMHDGKEKPIAIIAITAGQKKS